MYKQKAKMKQNKRLKGNRGITLIALVITIIVLLILAGVTIATLTGENGILNQASKAVEKNKQATEEEQRKLTIAEAAMNFENKEYVDENTDKAVVPAGFAVSQVEGENTIDDGLVIIDSRGNEFVWVPVDDFSKFVRTNGYKEGIKEQYKFVNDVDNKCYEPDLESTNTQCATPKTLEEAKKMYESVRKNKGFYIGRYETGTTDTTENGSGIRGETICKKGVTVYNNVKWGNSLTDENGGAVEISRKFATDEGYKTVTSTLCYGVQWDAVMTWMENVENPYSIGKKYIEDSTGMGWHVDNSDSKVHKAGEDVDDKKSNKVKNIYDMAGNVLEWTMEGYTRADGTICKMARGRKIY